MILTGHPAGTPHEWRQAAIEFDDVVAVQRFECAHCDAVDFRVA